MKYRSLFHWCMLGVVASMVVTVTAFFDLRTLPSTESLPHLRAVDPATLPGRYPQLEILLIKSNAAAVATAESLRGVSTNALELARIFLHREIVAGVVFASLFAYLALKMFHMSRSS